jgi:hypothetical protein
MKKALVVFLILAVAGGLFAQTLKLSGSVQTGLAVGFTDEDGDAGEPKIAFIRNRGEQGIRGDLNAVFTSADDAAYGKFGANLSFRLRETTFLGSDSVAPQNAPTINVWWQPNSFVWIQVGSGGPNPYNTMGGLGRELNVLDNQGLKIRLTPIAGLDVGLHAFYGAGGAGNVLVKNMNYGLGAKYTVSGLVAVDGVFRYYTEVKDYTKFQLGVGANFLGLSNLGFTKLAVDFGLYDNDTDKDNNFMGIGEAVGFTTGGLTLGVGAQQFIYNGKGDVELSMPMRFQAEVSYKVTPIITVGIEGRYYMGAKPNWGGNQWRNATDMGVDWENAAMFAGKDLSALGVSPRVTFNVGPEIVIGYNLQKDMSKDASGHTQNNLIYVGTNVSF